MSRVFCVSEPALWRKIANLQFGALAVHIEPNDWIRSLVMLHPKPEDLLVVAHAAVGQLEEIERCRKEFGLRCCLVGGRSGLAELAHRVSAVEILDLHGSDAEYELRLGNLLRSIQQAAQRIPRKSDVIVGSGKWHSELMDKINAVGPAEVPVAILGESGTGKELVARTIHRASPRRDGPFVVVNCAAIPVGLIEDELFGHVRGAFTDASRDREGLIASAQGGTLFLDEIGELPLTMQAKLLRFLQTHEIRKLGGDQTQTIDTRVVSATNRDLEAMVKSGTFREDLFYRICVVTVTLPPLRERSADLAMLANHILDRLCLRVGRATRGISQAALFALARYSFPGNVRELENKLHQALVVSEGDWISVGDLGLVESTSNSPAFDFGRSFRDQKETVVRDFESRYLTALLQAANGNMTIASELAGVDRKNLWALMRKHNIRRGQFRPDAGKVRMQARLPQRKASDANSARSLATQRRQAK